MDISVDFVKQLPESITGSRIAALVVEVPSTFGAIRRNFL